MLFRSIPQVWCLKNAKFLNLQNLQNSGLKGFWSYSSSGIFQVVISRLRNIVVLSYFLWSSNQFLFFLNRSPCVLAMDFGIRTFLEINGICSNAMLSEINTFFRGVATNTGLGEGSRFKSGPFCIASADVV